MRATPGAIGKRARISDGIGSRQLVPLGWHIAYQGKHRNCSKEVAPARQVGTLFRHQQYFPTLGYRGLVRVRADFPP
eukprot:8146805-Heterocapsa_arctica.AAC.1